MTKSGNKSSHNKQTISYGISIESTVKFDKLVFLSCILDVIL